MLVEAGNARLSGSTRPPVYVTPRRTPTAEGLGEWGWSRLELLAQG